MGRVSAIMADWTTFTPAVDSPLASAEIIKEAATVFVNEGIADPTMAVGVLETDFDLREVAVPARALLRRSRMMVATVKQAQMSQATGAAASSAPVPQAQMTTSLLQSAAIQGMIELMGADACAVAVANAITHGGKSVDIQDCLAQVNMDNIDYTLLSDLAVWQLLQSEQEAAAREQRTAFAYIDLTSKGLLPIWLAPDALSCPCFCHSLRQESVFSSAPVSLFRVVAVGPSHANFALYVGRLWIYHYVSGSTDRGRYL